MNITDIAINLSEVKPTDKVWLKDWLNENSNFDNWKVKELCYQRFKYLEYMSIDRGWVLSEHDELINKNIVSYDEFKRIISDN